MNQLTVFEWMSEIDPILIARASAPVKTKRSLGIRAVLIIAAVLATLMLAGTLASAAMLDSYVEQRYEDYDGTILHALDIVLTQDDNVVSSLLLEQNKQALHALFDALRGVGKEQEEQTTYTPSPVTDFEYEINAQGRMTITRYVGNDAHVVIPKRIEGKDVEVIGYKAFGGTNIQSIVMPDTVIYIFPYAFMNCESLESVTMSESLISIAENAFRNCSSLFKVDLSMNSMEFIEQEAFSGCQNLTEVKFGDHITLIGKQAFSDCVSLGQIILPKNLAELGEAAFQNCKSAQKIRIPKTLEVWGFYPFFGIESVTEIVFENGLKRIGTDEGGFCSKGQMQTVTIPASVEVISEGAFMECPNLKEVYFQGPAPQIGKGKFHHFVTIVQDVKIYYDPAMPGWDTTPLRDIYTLIPLTDQVVYDTVLRLYNEMLMHHDDVDAQTLKARSEQEEFFGDLYSLSYNIDLQEAGFAFHDINGDQKNELLLIDDDGVMFALYTQKAGKPIMIDYYGAGNHRGSIDENGIIYKDSYSGSENWTLTITQIMPSGELDRIEFGMYDLNSDADSQKAFLFRNGIEESVDKDQVIVLYKQYTSHVSYSGPIEIFESLEFHYAADWIE